VALWSPMNAFRLASERRRLLVSLRRAQSQAEEPVAWDRTRVSEHVFLFSSSTPATEDKTLVIGFASNAMRLTAPTYQILCALDPRRHSLLLLRDPARLHFEQGLPGIGASIEKVADWLKQAPQVCAFRNIALLGTSAGAVPALITSLRNGWPRA